mmetsp:Transcript_11609/g.25096  ORF Transcript_11609/g.25096 Transcript_11609/m.25096 type:complete len:88 (-) Transcript_11609:61-324(-)
MSRRAVRALESRLRAEKVADEEKEEDTDEEEAGADDHERGPTGFGVNGFSLLLDEEGDGEENHNDDDDDDDYGLLVAGEKKNGARAE